MANLSPEQVKMLLVLTEAIEIGLLIAVVILLILLWRAAVTLQQLLREAAQQPAAVLSILANPNILKAHPEVLQAIADRLSELSIEEVLSALDRKQGNGR